MFVTRQVRAACTFLFGRATSQNDKKTAATAPPALARLVLQQFTIPVTFFYELAKGVLLLLLLSQGKVSAAKRGRDGKNRLLT